MAIVISLLGGFLFYNLTNWFILSVFEERIAVENRLMELEGGSDNERTIEGDLSQRIFEPLLNRLVDFMSFIVPVDDERNRELSEQLIQAGIGLRGQQYRAAVVLFTVGLTLAFTLYGFATSANLGMKMLLLFLGIYGGVVISRFHLQSKITSRKNNISRQFPNVMDLLSVCVVAGLGFDQSIAYIVGRMEGDLIDQLKVLLRELSMGTPRHEALVRFSKRCGLQEIDMFVSALNQAEELGSPLANILETQAEDVRANHKQKTEEEAQKITIKMILPLVFFILPVIFIIILGPVVPSIMEGISGA